MPLLTIYHCTADYQWFDGTPCTTEDYVLSETPQGAKVLFWLWHQPGFKDLGARFKDIEVQPIAANVPLLFDPKGRMVKPVGDKALYDYVASRKQAYH